MEHLNLFNELRISTCLVSSDLIQRVMRKANSFKPQNQEEWSKISDILWTHLREGLLNYDDQLLCSTCFYSVIMLTNSQDCYLKDVQKIINEQLSIRHEIPRVNHKTALSVSLMYGIFQSSYLTKRINYNSSETLKSLLNSMFCMLLRMAYEYTKYTFIVFKTMKSFQKVCGTDLQDTIFNEDNQKIMLNMINHNWENPITGIRDLNREIMQVLLCTMSQVLIKKTLYGINNFYWNKAKFLMVACILKQSKVSISELHSDRSWIEGLILSLHKPGLVSAGTDMYFEVLKKMRTPNEWNHLFLEDVIKVLKGNSRKAVENFNNYWYLTTLKVFPSINEILLNELESISKTDVTLHSILFIMKQSNKLGIFEKDWTQVADREKNILNGLDHWDSSIRMLSFEILCTSQKTFVPSQLDCDLVLNYLTNNVNSDCTVLRISMLNSLNTFLTQLNSYYMNRGTKNEVALKVMICFCNRLQEFICRSLKIEGNYQRKISTIKIFNIVLNCFNNISTRKQKSKSEDALLKYLNVNNFWILSGGNIVSLLLDLLKDPSDDIRDNTAQLLLTFFYKEITSKNIFNQLIDNALENIRSKFFYKTDCGKTMFKLIINILIKDEHLTGTFKNLEEIFKFGLEQVVDMKNYKESIVDSIFEGKQQHSYMSILQCVLEVCYKNNHRLNILPNEIVKLLGVLEGISKQFAANDDTNTSTDFSQMNEMVEELIILSKYKCANEAQNDHESNITGLHQLALNCLWLNVKEILKVGKLRLGIFDSVAYQSANGTLPLTKYASIISNRSQLVKSIKESQHSSQGSCDLSAKLIQYYQDDVAISKQSLNIITHVLETSRHKGAIEAAGSALGLAIQHLTSLPQHSDLSKLPHDLLQCKLNELILEANNMASVTRRGAGLSIMVHRIVSSDVQKGKLLFHVFMQKLLEVCSNNASQEYKNTECLEKDLPKAIYIHFLTKIVTDSSLASHTLFYSTELAEIAFQNLTDPHWQIRNAALQLYGALVPKLIGQKKASGTQDESVATVACDEFRTHFPRLWTYIKKQLTAERPNTLITDSNLVPVLNLVASMAKRYNFSFEITYNEDIDFFLLKSLMKLLDSPIYVVRRLTAKCIFNMYPFEEIYKELLKQECYSENLLHGHLLLLKNYCYRYNDGGSELFNNLQIKYKSILEHRNHSYLCKELFEKVFKTNMNLEMMKEVLNSRNHKYEPGLCLWINSRINSYLSTAGWSEILDCLEELLKMDDCDQHLVTLSEKVINQSDIPLEVLQNMTYLLLRNKLKYKTFGLWKTLYSISLKTHILFSENIDQFIAGFSNMQYVSYKTRYILPFLSRNISKVKDIEQINNITNYIYNLLQNQTEDDMRQVAVIANNELALHFNKLSDPIRIVILTNAIMFLQDEDEAIRNISVNFLKNLKRDEFAFNPYICLTQIFNKQFLSSLFTDAEASMKTLYQKIMLIVSKNIPEKDVDDFNPFSTDTKNIYLEAQVLKEFMENIK